MLNIIRKITLTLAVISQFFVISSLYTNSAEAAARRCSIRNLVEEGARAERSGSNRFSINSIRGVEDITLKAASLTKLKKVFEKQNWTLGSRKDIKGIIEIAAANIKGNSREPSIQRSNKMAVVGREILKAIKTDLNKNEKKLVTYMIAEAVLRLEGIKSSEYKTGAQLDVFNKGCTLHINKFHDMVESYIDGTNKYKNLPNDGDLFSWPEIRGLYTNNSWAIGIRDHDMYHLHYAYGHPYYLAINFQSSRSINDRRYIYISALWESVDTFRTTLENSMANYYKRKNMSAEEGMLELGSATEKELDAIEAEIGAPNSVRSYSELSYAQGWRPTKSRFGRRAATSSEEVFLKELSDFINESFARAAKRGSSKYTNYHRLGPDSQSTTDNNTIP